jgi:adenylate cyclase
VATVPEDVRAYLRELGATDAEIDDAAAEGNLPGLASDLVLRRPATMTPEEVVARVPSLDLPFLIEAYRLLGIAIAPGERVLGEDDIAMMQLIADPRTGVVFAGGDDLLRVIATSLARIGDAVVAGYVQQVETGFDESHVISSSLEWVRTNADSTEIGLVFGTTLGTLFRHHLRGAIARQRESSKGTGDRALARLAVGFVDLVGFTPYSRTLSVRALLDVVRRFETTAFDVAASNGGRVVKHIGDEIMFTALGADAGGRIAVELVSAFGEDIHPRGGMSFGDVLTVHGDYYGPVVNLASRLTDGAVPGEVLVDATTAAALEDVTTEPAGRRMLKGFDEPVTVFSLVG